MAPQRTKELETVLNMLNKVRPSGAGYSAICPAHEDTDPSMSITLGKEQQVMFNCHRGCTVDDITKALGLDMKNLWPPKKDKPKQERTWVANYDYHDTDGTLIFQVMRWALPNGRKSFTQRKPTSTGDWEYSTLGLDKPLYRLPQIVNAIKNGETIYITEGEKDVNTLVNWGVPATCNSGGAGSWLPGHTKTLLNATNITIVTDRDAVGLKHARNIQQELEDNGLTVNVVAPPEPSKDVTAYQEIGGTLNNLEPVNFENEQLDPYLEAIAELRTIGNKDWKLSRKLSTAQHLLDQIGNEPTDTTQPVKWHQFLNQDIPPYDWIIPGLLERQERVIVVAAEGVGKSMLARQIALMTSAGIHPFKKTRIEPIRTLYLDLENPERIIMRTSQKILKSVQLLRGNHPLQADLLMKPDGLNILNAEDRLYLETIVEKSNPDILFIGPLYKLFVDPGGRTSEAVTTEVVRFLDHIRTTYNCALWLEHHAPFGSSMAGRELRPFGSAVWSRWPEFGLALKPDPTIQHHYELQHFRGARDEREWPTTLTRGEMWPFDAQY